MNLPNLKRNDTAGVSEILGRLREKGVRLWTQGGELRFRAPKGSVTPEEIEKLAKYKSRIFAILDKRSAGSRLKLDATMPFSNKSAPLGFSQLGHWNLYGLNKRKSLRQVASATRLRGSLDLQAVHLSLDQVMSRHSALRTRISRVDDVPVQCVCETHHHEFEMRRIEASDIQKCIEEFISRRIDLAVDPLFGVLLLELGETDHVLVFTMEHMISDAVSMHLLLREFFTVYGQLVRGSEVALPAAPTQLIEYAARQRAEHDAWMRTHGQYWQHRLAGCGRVRFPNDDTEETDLAAWSTTTISIDAQLTAELKEWCRRRGTTVAMAVFTVVAALALRWCRVEEMVFPYISDGRLEERSQNAIGYFASTLFLRVRLTNQDDFVSLLERITNEYCCALEHADLGYIDSSNPRPEFAWNFTFNWIPQMSMFDSVGSDLSLNCEALEFQHPMFKSLQRDSEPVILLYYRGDDIIGNIHFPSKRFRRETMGQFGRNILMYVKELLGDSDRLIKHVPIF